MLGSIVRMAILQTKKQTDIEKRLRLLRQQVYGKERVSNEYQVTSDQTSKASGSHTTNLYYLYTDLLKIGLFATLAIGAQLVLLFLNLF